MAGEPLRVAITLPQFRDDPAPALDAARRAESAGLDGVFVFDHLWPLRQPGRPALAAFPLLGALGAETERIILGTLVARVGLVPDAVLVHSFVSLRRIAGSRVIAGVGIGDSQSRAENEAYGVAFASAGDRRASLAATCRALRAESVATWVGGNGPATRAVGRAEADAVNLWELGVEDVAAEAAQGGAVTWAGRVDLGAGDGLGALTGLLAALAGAGATWAVLAPIATSWPAAVELIGAARQASVD